MILFRAEAILALSNSKFGPGVPLIEREDLRSSTDSTISTSLIHCIASIGNCEQVHTSVLNPIFHRAFVVGVGICQSEDPKSAVFVGQPHNPLKIFPHKGRKNFWLPVLTGISDPKLCLGLGVHSLHAVMCLPLRWKSKDWILLDKVMKKTPVDLQKRFPIYHAYPKYLAAHRCGSAFSQDGSASLQDDDKVEKTPVDWERGIFHCVMIQHL